METGVSCEFQWEGVAIGSSTDVHRKIPGSSGVTNGQEVNTGLTPSKADTMEDYQEKSYGKTRTGERGGGGWV